MLNEDLMTAPLQWDRLTTFRAETSPAPSELGRALERNIIPAHTRLCLSFGDRVAGIPISDLWSACCELLLQAQLVREGWLHRFVLDLEHVFDVSCMRGVILCRFSPEHVFVVEKEEFAASLDDVVQRIFAGTHCPSVVQIAAEWAASEIRARPYAHRFTDFLLT